MATENENAAAAPGARARGIVFRGLVPYAEGVRLQEELVRARIEERIPDVVLFLEHAPVVTLGMRSRPGHVLLSSAELDARGIGLCRTSRGGDVTFHCPGQLVMYPILRLGEREADAHGYLRNLEEIAIRTACDFNVRAFRRDGLTGAWTQGGKLAAIGIRFKRWVTFHGMSFNVSPDLSGFSAIVPCGLRNEPVTSLRELLGGAAPSVSAVRERMAIHFADVCGRPMLCMDAPDNASNLPGIMERLKNAR